MISCWQIAHVELDKKVSRVVSNKKVTNWECWWNLKIILIDHAKIVDALFGDFKILKYFDKG